jgi:hypothetical protein
MPLALCRVCFTCATPLLRAARDSSDSRPPAHPSPAPAAAVNCPDGSKDICNGPQCPTAMQVPAGEPFIVCDVVSDVCENDTTGPRRCWGVVTCPLGTCPPGFEEGFFCYSDGASANDKVCCAEVQLGK